MNGIDDWIGLDWIGRIRQRSRVVVCCLVCCCCCCASRREPSIHPPLFGLALPARIRMFGRFKAWVEQVEKTVVERYPAPISRPTDPPFDLTFQCIQHRGVRTDRDAGRLHTTGSQGRINQRSYRHQCFFIVHSCFEYHCGSARNAADHRSSHDSLSNRGALTNPRCLRQRTRTYLDDDNNAQPTPNTPTDLVH